MALGWFPFTLSCTDAFQSSSRLSRSIRPPPHRPLGSPAQHVSSNELTSPESSTLGITSSTFILFTLGFNPTREGGIVKWKERWLWSQAHLNSKPLYSFFYLWFLDQPMNHLWNCLHTFNIMVVYLFHVFLRRWNKLVYRTSLAWCYQTLNSEQEEVAVARWPPGTLVFSKTLGSVSRIFVTSV